MCIYIALILPNLVSDRGLMIEFQKAIVKSRCWILPAKKMPRLSGFVKTCLNVGIVSC